MTVTERDLIEADIRNLGIEILKIMQDKQADIEVGLTTLCRLVGGLAAQNGVDLEIANTCTADAYKVAKEAIEAQKGAELAT